MSLMDEIVMVVVDGVRYRPEDAPQPPAESEPKQKRAPANKAAAPSADKA